MVAPKAFTRFATTSARVTCGPRRRMSSVTVTQGSGCRASTATTAANFSTKATEIGTNHSKILSQVLNQILEVPDSLFHPRLKGACREVGVSGQHQVKRRLAAPRSDTEQSEPRPRPQSQAPEAVQSGCPPAEKTSAKQMEMVKGRTRAEIHQMLPQGVSKRWPRKFR